MSMINPFTGKPIIHANTPVFSRRAKVCIGIAVAVLIVVDVAFELAKWWGTAWILSGR